MTIGVPVYNGEKHLAEALDSLLDQTYEDFELIVSDNGSTDRTPEIALAYAERDPRVRYVRHDVNRGAAWNFNYVFQQGRGEYFRWAAHDDLCRSTFLARCVEILDTRPDVVWCHSRSRTIDGEGRSMDTIIGGEISYVARRVAADGREGRRRRARPTRESPRPHERFWAVLVSDGNRDIFGLMRSRVARRTALQQPFYGADKVFVAELSLAGRYEEIPEPLFIGRIHTRGSGALRSSTEQQRFIDPSRRPTLVRLRLLKAHTGAILRADLDFAERARCFSVLFRYLTQIRKWRKVVTRAVKGTGTGGGYLPALRKMSQPVNGPGEPEDGGSRTDERDQSRRN